MDSTNNFDGFSIHNIDTFVHEPVRLGILLLLRIHKKLSFLKIQSALDVTPGNLNSHINKLLEKNYIRAEKMFVNLKPQTIIVITEEGNKAILSYIKGVKKLIGNSSN
ncbi:MAG: transcriptional regulator [Candidatus Thorarchaeota archaeon]